MQIIWLQLVLLWYILFISQFNMLLCSISSIVQFCSVQSLSRVRLFVTPWIAARQVSLSINNTRSSLRLTSIESVMPSSHLILCHPLLLLPPTPPSISLFQWVNSPWIWVPSWRPMHSGCPGHSRPDGHPDGLGGCPPPWPAVSNSGPGVSSSAQPGGRPGTHPCQLPCPPGTLVASHWGLLTCTPSPSPLLQPSSCQPQLASLCPLTVSASPCIPLPSSLPLAPGPPAPLSCRAYLESPTVWLQACCPHYASVSPSTNGDSQGARHTVANYFTSTVCKAHRTESGPERG